METKKITDTISVILDKDTYKLLAEEGSMFGHYDSTCEYWPDTICEYEHADIVRELKENEVALILTYKYNEPTKHPADILIEKILNFYGKTRECVFVHCREEEVLGIRRIIQAMLWYCSRIGVTHKKLTLSKIGRMTGYFDHATVLNSARKVKAYYQTNKVYRQRIDDLLSFLKIEERFKEKKVFDE